MDLQQIKTYFGNSMVRFNSLSSSVEKLSIAEKKIFFDIGLPDYGGYGGSYMMTPELILKDDKYLQFATRKKIGNGPQYFEYLDLQAKKVVFKFYDNEYIVLNSSLEAYLVYVYIYVKFFREIRLGEKFGIYELNHEKYAAELKRRLLEYNDDVLQGSWAALIEEMEYGVV